MPDDGKYVFKVDKEGTYKINIKPREDNGTGLNIEAVVNDLKAPTYTTKMEYYDFAKEADKKGVKIIVEAQDNKNLKSITFNGKKQNVSGTTASAEFNVTKSGKYKVEIEDAAGNITKGERSVTFDESEFKVEKVEVKKNGKVVNNPRLKIGDKISVTVTTNKAIVGLLKGSLNRLYTIYGYAIKSNNGFIPIKSTTFEINDIEITQDLIEEMTGKESYSGYVNFEIFGLTDYFGNSIDYSYKNKIYVDTVKPKIEEVTITGGGESKDKNIIYVDEKDEDIVIEILSSEKLGTNPSVRIGGCEKIYKASANNKNGSNKVTKNGKEYFSYIVKKSGKEILNDVKNKTGILAVKVYEYKDLAGNVGDSYLVNKSRMSANKKYLYHGSLEFKNLYIARAGKSNANIPEDVNKDGFVTAYDSYLMTRKSVGLIPESREESYSFVDLDKDGKFTASDAQKILDKAEKNENSIKVNEEVMLKVYDAGGRLLVGEDVKYELPKDIKNVEISKDTVGGTITIKAKKKDVKEIPVKVIYQENGRGDTHIANIVIKVK